jgi:hypothetical protein
MQNKSEIIPVIFVDRPESSAILSGEANPWGYSEVCHLIVSKASGNEGLQALHDKAHNLGISKDDFIAAPVPHYRMTRQRRMKAIKSGVVALDAEKFDVLMDEWLG